MKEEDRLLVRFALQSGQGGLLDSRWVCQAGAVNNLISDSFGLGRSRVKRCNASVNYLYPGAQFLSL